MNSACKTVLLFLFCLCPAYSFAQIAAPTADQMIQQLKAPKTRGLRNLSVEATSSKAASDSSAETADVPTALVASPEKPSLSLLIQFDFNSARVRPESQQALANLSQALQSQELLHSNFSIEGHTDAKGRSDQNQKLSQQRANAVSDFLKKWGVADARLVATGKGAAELANTADPFAPENRRVRIVNLD
jgi:outer membrane protein OmpA-like peptidoglycan-associated protein